MENYAGIDVSLELASVRVVDAKGTVVKETKVDSNPQALVALFNGLGFPVTLYAHRRQWDFWWR